jgi:hypothetical protein
MKKTMILVALLIFLTACSGINTRNTTSGTPDGIKISFLELQPRDELRIGETFDVGLELENKADCDIYGQICVRDLFTSSISGVQDQCQEFELRKKDITTDSKKVYFTDNSYNTAIGDLKSTIIATATYSCNIQLNPQLCVKSSIGDESLCKNMETLSQNTLGLKTAPITITQIDKLLIPQSNNVKMEVTLHLRKMSEGNIEGPLGIILNYEGYGNLQCRDLDKLKWEEKDTEKIIKCEIPLNVKDVEDNPLIINLNYNYKNSKTKQVQIIKEGDI